MAGSWEILANPTVLVGILHVDTTTVAWSLGLRNLQINGPVMPVSGMPFDHARNACAMKALEVGADYLGFLDSDVIPPRDAFPRLLAHRKPIVSAVYSRRSPPHGIPVAQKPVGQWVTSLPRSGLVEVDVVGCGCCVIRRDVLKALPPSRPGRHWFDWRVDMKGTEGEQLPLSEDFTFFYRCKQLLGIPVLLDTSIRCRHVGHAEADFGSFLPLNCTPVT